MVDAPVVELPDVDDGVVVVYVLELQHELAAEGMAAVELPNVDEHNVLVIPQDDGPDEPEAEVTILLFRPAFLLPRQIPRQILSLAAQAAQ